jgi:hypothetical protein
MYKDQVYAIYGKFTFNIMIQKGENILYKTNQKKAEVRTLTPESRF